uniref:Uncharacterized protein n=1 Tax=Myotis myotis TaxID=51298 RepID=A0A7J7TTR7_MYOMY|nr:hypothetical protein mMyoMyo1_008975 [Myotis myotis]
MAPGVEAPAPWPRPCVHPSLWTSRWSFVSFPRSGCVRCSPLPPPLRCRGPRSTGGDQRPSKATRSQGPSEPAAAAPATGKEIVAAMVPASPAPAPGCRLRLCPAPSSATAASRILQKKLAGGGRSLRLP